MENVLNPALFHSLKRRFGHVRIANQGVHYQAIDDKNANGKPYSRVLEPGEQYRVNCPFCGDKRQRLYIGYMWNTFDKTLNRRTCRFLAHCFNEECSMRNLETELTPYVMYNAVIPPTNIITMPVKEMFPEVKLPGRCVDLSKLPDQHPALAYIRSRQFEPKELAQEWGVVYCEGADRDSEGFIPGTRAYANLVENRIVIPLMWQSRLVGWQARSLSPDTKTIKYYTMPGLQKNYMLFNGDRARLHRFGVVVEGVFDAFRVGTRAVALLGSSMSAHQRALISAFWSTGAMCLLLDPDAIEDMERMSQMFAQGTFRWGSFSVTLPDNNDPAEMDRERLWATIASYAHARQIPLTSV